MAVGDVDDDDDDDIIAFFLLFPEWVSDHGTKERGGEETTMLLMDPGDWLSYVGESWTK